MSSRCTAIVPFRADTSGWRLNSVEVVTRWLAAMGVAAVVVEHDEVSRLDTDRLSGAHHEFISSSGPFSKALACNIGFAAVDTPVVALVDSDTMVASRAFLGCVARCDEAGSQIDVIRPFGRLIELDEDATRSVYLTGHLPEALAAGQDNTRGGEFVPMCGGIVVMRSAAYVSAGGMDESFIGWGGEDDALSVALCRAGAVCRVLVREPAFHLYHRRPIADRYEQQHYGSNLARLRWWRESSDEAVAGALRAGAQHLRELRPS